MTEQEGRHQNLLSCQTTPKLLLPQSYLSLTTVMPSETTTNVARWSDQAFSSIIKLVE